MVKWGSVELPELEHRPRIGGKPERWPAEPGVVHLPTGMRLDYDIKALPFIDRGQWQELLLYAPPGEDWQVHIVTAVKAPGLTNRIVDYLGTDLHQHFHWSFEKQEAAKHDFLSRFGQEFVCYRVDLREGSAMPEWTAERREAMLLLLFAWLEHPWTNDKDPYPSTLTFCTDDVPEVLHGTFRNPAWERLQ